MPVMYKYPLTKQEVTEGYTDKVWDGSTYLCRIESRIAQAIILELKQDELKAMREILDRNKREYEIRRKYVLYKE